MLLPDCRFRRCCPPLCFSGRKESGTRSDSNSKHLACHLRLLSGEPWPWRRAMATIPSSMPHLVSRDLLRSPTESVSGSRYVKRALHADPHAEHFALHRSCLAGLNTLKDPAQNSEFIVVSPLYFGLMKSRVGCSAQYCGVSEHLGLMSNVLCTRSGGKKSSKEHLGQVTSCQVACCKTRIARLPEPRACVCRPSKVGD